MIKHFSSIVIRLICVKTFLLNYHYHKRKTSSSYIIRLIRFKNFPPHYTLGCFAKKLLLTIVRLVCHKTFALNSY